MVADTGWGGLAAIQGVLCAAAGGAGAVWGFTGGVREKDGEGVGRLGRVTGGGLQCWWVVLGAGWRIQSGGFSRDTGGAPPLRVVGG